MYLQRQGEGPRVLESERINDAPGAEREIRNYDNCSILH